MNHANQREPQYVPYCPKIVLLGADAVGKSKFVRKLCSNTFSNDYTPTVGAEYEVKNLQLPQRPLYDCHIWDAAGLEKFTPLTPIYLKGSHSVLICFSVGNLESFYKAQGFLDLARRNCSPNAYILLIGMKSDLRLNPNNSLVGVFEAQDFATSQGIEYIETSAKNGINVNEIFEKAAREVISRVDHGILEARPQRGNNDGDGSGCPIVCNIF